MQIPVLHLLTILAAFCGFLLGGLLLVSPYYRSKSNRYLALSFYTIGLVGINYVLSEVGWENVWFVIFNDVMWEYLFGPFLFLHFAAQAKRSIATSSKRFLLYLPFLFTLIFNLVIDADMELGIIELGVKTAPLWLTSYYLIESIGTVLYTLALIIWAWFIIRENAEKDQVGWAKSFWIWCISATCLWAINWLTTYTFDLDFGVFLFTIIMLMFFWVGYQGVVRLKLAGEKKALSALLAMRTSAPTSQPLRAATSAATNTSPYLAQFRQLMATEKWYRDPLLSRDVVAERLGISSSHLSTQLSGSEAGSFTDYVNGWRVKEVQQMLQDSDFDQYSLLSIGLEAGFNSKSAFYNTFRKLTGQTPSAYKKAIRAQKAAVPL